MDDVSERLFLSIRPQGITGTNEAVGGELGL